MYQFKIEIELPDGREATFVHNPPMVRWDQFAADNDAHLVRLFCEAREWVGRPQSQPGEVS